MLEGKIVILPRVFKCSEKVRIYVLNDLFSDKPDCFWEICRKMLVKIKVTLLKIFASDKIEAVKFKVITNLLGQFQSIKQFWLRSSSTTVEYFLSILNWEYVHIDISQWIYAYTY